MAILEVRCTIYSPVFKGISLSYLGRLATFPCCSLSCSKHWERRLSFDVNFATRSYPCRYELRAWARTARMATVWSHDASRCHIADLGYSDSSLEPFPRLLRIFSIIYSSAATGLVLQVLHILIPTSENASLRYETIGARARSCGHSVTIFVNKFEVVAAKQMGYCGELRSVSGSIVVELK